jgi:hypothetical protein
MPKTKTKKRRLLCHSCGSDKAKAVLIAPSFMKGPACLTHHQTYGGKRRYSLAVIYKHQKKFEKTVSRLWADDLKKAEIKEQRRHGQS